MRTKVGTAALVLNASYEPLTVVSTRRAIILLLAQKAESLVDDDTLTWDSPSYVIPMPVVIRLMKYVKIPHSTHVGLSRRALMARDGYRCVYCKTTEDLTIDHVIPRSKGGTHTWENVVVSCRKDNSKKGQRSLEELGWTLPKAPRAPSGTAWRVMGYRTPDPRWVQWLNQ